MSPPDEKTTALAVPRATFGISEIRAMAEAVARGGLFLGVKSPEAAATLMWLCQAEGLHPIVALRRYHIIDGKPSMRADAMLADFQRAGGRVTWLRSDEQTCEAEFRPPNADAGLKVSWTMADAKRADLDGKPNWKKYPRQMLRARTISEGIRAVIPEIVAGVYTPEEVQDFDDGEPGKVEYTPPARAEASTTAPTPPPEPAATEPADPEHERRLERVCAIIGKDLGWEVRTAVAWLEEVFGVPRARDLSPEQSKIALTLTLALATSREHYDAELARARAETPALIKPAVAP